MEHEQNDISNIFGPNSIAMTRGHAHTHTHSHTWILEHCRSMAQTLGPFHSFLLCVSFIWSDSFYTRRLIIEDEANTLAHLSSCGSVHKEASNLFSFSWWRPLLFQLFMSTKYETRSIYIYEVGQRSKSLHISIVFFMIQVQCMYVIRVFVCLICYSDI